MGDVHRVSEPVALRVEPVNPTLLRYHKETDDPVESIAFHPMRKGSESPWEVTTVVGPLRLMLREPRAMHLHL